MPTPKPQTARKRSHSTYTMHRTRKKIPFSKPASQNASLADGQRSPPNTTRCRDGSTSGFHHTRQLFLASSADRREVFGESHEWVNWIVPRTGREGRIKGGHLFFLSFFFLFGVALGVTLAPRVTPPPPLLLYGFVPFLSWDHQSLMRSGKLHALRQKKRNCPKQHKTPLYRR